jgi:hypothetical protein
MCRGASIDAVDAIGAFASGAFAGPAVHRTAGRDLQLPTAAVVCVALSRLLLFAQ